MKTFVKAFTTINNRSSSAHGVKKLSNIKKTKNLTTLLEGFGDLTVLSCNNSSNVVICRNRTKMSLRKSNKTAWVSKGQELSFNKSKRKVCVYFSKNELSKSTTPSTKGRRVFIKIN